MQKKKRATKRHTTPSQEVSLTSVCKSVLLTLPIIMTIGLVLLLCTTALLLATKDPNAYHTAAGLVLLYLITLIGGAIATRLHARRTPLFCGVAMGSAMLLLLLVLSLILPGSEHTYKSTLQIGLHALLLPTAIAGALLGAREKNASRRRTK
ncbi:MAG: hypothetical protein IJC95_01445 [Clostridia bacterium]|nr:hypothetical protein [Clostridia bacterium]